MVAMVCRPIYRHKDQAMISTCDICGSCFKHCVCGKLHSAGTDLNEVENISELTCYDEHKDEVEDGSV